MKVHFIAIGGSAMHNLALALHHKGYEVTGSDDEFFNPSKGRLEKYGLLPESEGWDPARITEDLDAVILGMHARENNPELQKAKDLGLTIYSYPEYLYEQSKNKTRVVIAGSHGKTTITSMILHVLHYHEMDCDYMVGAQLEGFETMVKLTPHNEFIVLEGDEYLSSPIDRRPKFHLYKPNIALLSGIAWDHINVFPTYDNYKEQFEIFINQIEKGGALIYCQADSEVVDLVENTQNEIKMFPYNTPTYYINDGVTYLETPEGDLPLEIFGEHNLTNMEGARWICNQMGVTDEQFYEAIASFKGASKRLELIAKNDNTVIYKDFAHSPSKVSATLEAVKKQYPKRELIACLELHTFSSLNTEFLQQYKGAMDNADVPVVYYSPKAIAHKKLAPISEEQVRQAFDKDDLTIFTDSDSIQSFLKEKDWANKNLLLMSSGNFDGIDLNTFGQDLIQ